MFTCLSHPARFYAAFVFGVAKLLNRLPLTFSGQFAGKMNCLQCLACWLRY